jgi:hypothetical protein
MYSIGKTAMRPTFFTLALAIVIASLVTCFSLLSFAQSSERGTITGSVNRPPQLWMPTENVSSRYQLVGDACREVRELLVEERGKSIEVGEAPE